jgi:hypothetical protein
MKKRMEIMTHKMRESAADLVVRLAQENEAKFYHWDLDPLVPLVAFHPIGQERISTRVTDKKFLSWLSYLFHQETKVALRYSAQTEAVSLMVGLALYSPGSSVEMRPETEGSR